MKLVSFDDFRIGLLKGDSVVDVTDLLEAIPQRDPADRMAGLIARFEDYRPALEMALAEREGTPVAAATLGAPLPRPRQIDCMATNYLENGTLQTPFAINAFHKSPGAVIGPGGTLVLPDIPATVFEAEAEMAVVIGKRASHVRAEAAMDHVFGYVNFIDGSARGLPPSTNSFFQVKSRDTFAPLGPCVVTADEIADPHALRIRLWVNGELRQDFNTDDMAYRIPRCIEWLSSIHALEPGDILATGTNHRGLSALHDGDRIELETEGLGRLDIRVRDELRREWTRETRLQGSEKLVAKGEKAPPTGVPARQIAGKYAP